MYIYFVFFLFFTRLRFPLSKWILKIIKHCYCKRVLKLVRRFERTDLRCRKAELDLSVLKYCFLNVLTPKFLHFKDSNRSLKLSDTYKQCQIWLLIEEISNKKSELILLKKHIKTSMNVINYAHICSIFLISNNKVLTKQNNIQDCKVIGLIKGKGSWDIHSQRVLYFSLLARTLKFRNTVVHLSYYTVKLVILVKKAVIKNFSKAIWKYWAYLPIVDWSIAYLKKTWTKRN